MFKILFVSIFLCVNFFMWYNCLALIGVLRNLFPHPQSLASIPLFIPKSRKQVASSNLFVLKIRTEISISGLPPLLKNSQFFPSNSDFQRFLFHHFFKLNSSQNIMYPKIIFFQKNLEISSKIFSILFRKIWHSPQKLTENLFKSPQIFSIFAPKQWQPWLWH